MASAALGAVLSARRSGEAQLVQVSATDMLMTQMDRRAMGLLGYQLTGDITERPFGKARAHPAAARPPPVPGRPGGDRTSPAWVPRMLATLADPGLTRYFAEHPDAAVGAETAELLEPVLRAWLSARTRTECFEQATLAHGWPVFPGQSAARRGESPNFTDRGLFVEFDHPVAGRQRQLGPPWRMAEGGFDARRAAPVSGSTTRSPRLRGRNAAAAEVI